MASKRSEEATTTGGLGGENTSLTARSRTSGEYRLVLFITPSSHVMESPINPGRFTCKRAGIPGAWIHDLRRTAVRNLECAGVSRSVAMKLTGHKTEAVYRRYAIADSAAFAEGVEKLARLHAEKPHKRKILPLNPAGNGTNTAQSGHGRVAQG
ncbi:MAG: hypothetical protein O6851_08425 [Gemmatimonadetes bacterium]|nr:hypothetical protein [Gemmatimonadota bacterium]